MSQYVIIVLVITDTHYYIYIYGIYIIWHQTVTDMFTDTPTTDNALI